MNIDRNAASIVSNGDRSIHMDDHFDLRAKSREMFVNGVINDFVNQVMQPSLIRISDEHPRPFPDRFEAFKFVDLRRVVFLCGRDSGRAARYFFDRNFFLNLRHKSGPTDPQKGAYPETVLKQQISSWL